MSVFLEKYVREPLNALLVEADAEIADFSITLRGGQVEFKIGDEVLSVEHSLDGAAEVPAPFPNGSS